jgi:hypothetical protein
MFLISPLISHVHLGGATVHSSRQIDQVEACVGEVDVVEPGAGQVNVLEPRAGQVLAGEVSHPASFPGTHWSATQTYLAGQHSAVWIPDLPSTPW